MIFSLPTLVCFSSSRPVIIVPPRHLSWRLLGLHPQFLVGQLPPSRRHQVSPPPSPHSDSSSDCSGSLPNLGSPPVTFTMSTSRPTTSSHASNIVGSISSGTTTGPTSTAPLLPYMAGLSLPDFNQLINDPILVNVCMMQLSQAGLPQPASASQQPQSRPLQLAPSPLL